MTTAAPTRRRNVPVLAVSQVLGSIAFGLLLTIASTSLSVLTSDDAIAGMGQASIIIGASLITLPVAALSQRYGRRIGLTTAYGLATLGALILAIAYPLGWWPVMIAGLLACGGGTVAGLAIRFAASDEARTATDVPRLIAIVMWASTVGSVLGPNLAGPLTSAVGDDYFGTAYALIAAIFGLAMLLILVGMRSTASAATQRPRGPSLGEQLRIIRAEPRVALGMLVSAFGHAMMVGLMAMAPVTMHHHDAHPGLIGLAMSSHLAAMYVLSPLVGSLVARLGPDRVVAIGMGILLASAVALAASGGSSLPLLFTGLVLLGIGWSCTMIAGSSMVTQEVEPEVRVSIQGATDLSINVLGGVASLLSGILVNAAGYPTLGIVATGLIAAVWMATALWTRGGAAPR